MADDLREEIRQLRERLARLEQLQQRRDNEAWREFQRERAEAIKSAERVSGLLQGTAGMPEVPSVNAACGVHGPFPCEGARCICTPGVQATLPPSITPIDAMCAILKDQQIESCELTDCAVLYTVTFDQLRALYDRGRATACGVKGLGDAQR